MDPRYPKPNHGKAFHPTEKQRQIMTLLVKGNPDGSFLDLDQLRDSLPYTPSKEALTWSIRYLIGHGVMEKGGTEKRRKARRRILKPTEAGYAMFGPQFFDPKSYGFET